MSLRPTLEFLLYNWLNAESLNQRERFADHSRETFDAVFDTCERIAREKYAPFNRLVDTQEPQFDGEKVTSVDWASHPTLRHSDTPESIDVVLVNGDPNPDRPDLPPYGAGEGSHKPMIAAVANAIFDATGVRLRRPPFRSERVLAALRAENA